MVSNANIFRHRNKRRCLHSTFSPIDVQTFIIPTCDDGTVRWVAITAGHFLMLRAANLQFLLATFSIRLFTSPALTHVYIPLFLAQSISPFDFKNLKRIGDNKVSPFMLLIRDTLRCLRYEKEPRSSPSPWYRRQGYYALVSTFRPTPRQQNIPRLFHLLRLFILTHVHTSLI